MTGMLRWRGEVFPEPEFLRIFSADIQPACPKRAKGARMEDCQPCTAELPAEARGVHARIYIDAEEAEFRAA